ncbi:LapA family protein [Ekhidna sp.]|uniref:LapA family protein n=1 Tax=Ekhidna sp. TaxID=2608089 RepID=UPI003299E0F2
MKLFRIILILVFVLAIVIFSVQNAEVVEVRFLGWSVETSRALLMLVCVAVGSLCTTLALLPALIGRSKKEKFSPSGSLQAEEESN